MDLPKQMRHVLNPCESVFSTRVWEWAKELVRGTILVPGERTMAALRVVGRASEQPCAQPSALVEPRTQPSVSPLLVVTHNPA